MLSLFKHFIESLATRLLQRVGVEVLRHADAVCTARARRDLEMLDLAKELEARGARELAKDLRSRVLAGDAQRLPCLEAEVSRLLLPADNAAAAAAGGNGNGEGNGPLPLPARGRKPRRPARVETSPNGLPALPPGQGKES